MSLSFCSMFPFNKDTGHSVTLPASPEQGLQASASLLQAPPLNASSSFGMPFLTTQAGKQESVAAVSPFSFPLAAPSSTSLFHAAPMPEALASASVPPPKSQGPSLPFAEMSVDEVSIPRDLTGKALVAFPVSPFAPSAAGFAQTGETAPHLAAAELDGISPFGMADLEAAASFKAPLMPPPSPPLASALRPLIRSQPGGITHFLESSPPAVQQSTAPLPPKVGSSSRASIQAHATDPDQIVLRALLDTDAELCSPKVVELVCRLPGIAACVYLHSKGVVSHIDAQKPQAYEFQKQATELATHLRSLAPLIGMKDNETFMIQSGERIMTFCFPGDTIFAVLHDREPTLSQRDKITLIAREMVKLQS